MSDVIHDERKRKIYQPESYYHIFNRGVNKQEIFHDKEDYNYFLGVIKRLLSEKPIFNPNNKRPYANFHNTISVLAFALMPNHFHLLIFQVNERDIVAFMKSLSTAYSMYYNEKYKRVGPVFQGRYWAKRIMEEETLAIVSRYIHINPKDWQHSMLTSLDFYSGRRRASWVNPDRILKQFPSFEAYMQFLETFNTDDEKQLFDLDPK